MTTQVDYKGQATRHLSPHIWGNLPITKWACGLGGVFFFDDFLNVPDLSTPAATLRYQSVETGGGTITGIAEEGGVVRMLTDSTAEDEMGIQTSGITGAFVSADVDDLYDIAFECRIRTNTVTDDDLAWFVGLAEEGCAAANILDTDGVMADKDYIGFNVKNDDGNSIDFVYRRAGDSAGVIKIAGLAVPTTDVWVKLGFKISPNHSPSQRIKVFSDVATSALPNGVGLTESSTYVTQANMETATAGALFPDDQALAPLFVAQAGGSAANTDRIDMDWWAVGAEI